MHLKSPTLPENSAFANPADSASAELSSLATSTENPEPSSFSANPVSPSDHIPLKDNSVFKLVYDLNDKPRSWRDTFFYSLQYTLMMFCAVVWGYSIVGINIGFSSAELSAFMARVVLMIGLTTLIQALAGHKLSLFSGPNIVPSLAIVVAFELGGKDYVFMAFNAYIIAGLIVAFLAACGLISYIGKIWNKLVLGSLILMIGLVTSTVGIKLLAAHGAGWPFLVGLGLGLTCGFLSLKGKGFIATIPVLIIVPVGYLVFMLTGYFDWDLFLNMPGLIIPKFLPYGFSLPSLDLILTMTIIHLLSSLNFFGNVNAYAELVNKKLSPKTEKRYLIFFGLIEGSLCSLFGVPSYIMYGENISLTLLTRIASRIFIIIAATAFICLSFLGNFAGLMAAMPKEVAGAILLGVGSSLIGLGAKFWQEHKKYLAREIFITGFAVFFAFGLAQLEPEFYGQLPNSVAMLCKNPIITVILVVMILDKVVLREKKIN